MTNHQVDVEETLNFESEEIREIEINLPAYPKPLITPSSWEKHDLEAQIQTRSPTTEKENPNYDSTSPNDDDDSGGDRNASPNSNSIRPPSPIYLHPHPTFTLFTYTNHIFAATYRLVKIAFVKLMSRVKVWFIKTLWIALGVLWVVGVVGGFIAGMVYLGIATSSDMSQSTDTMHPALPSGVGLDSERWDLWS